jgi:hypothetical protein
MTKKTIGNQHFVTFTSALIATVVLAPTSAPAQTGSTEPTPSSLNQLLECRNLASNEARLTCFDTQATRLAQETASGELVPVYKSEIAEARRGLFGIDRLKVPGFLAAQDAEEELGEVETTLELARKQGAGPWRFVLTDGSTWDQIDSSDPYFSNRAGTQVRIRRASMGSYLMTIGRSPAIRVSRRN